MRISHCESHCIYLSCLPKSKEASSDAVSAAPTPDKPPLVQMIEVEGNDNDDVDKKETTAVVAVPKSSLKKANCADSAIAAKGGVKWLDLLGKDLTEVREFEPSESGNSQDDGDGNSACTCAIQ